MAKKRTFKEKQAAGRAAAERRRAPERRPSGSTPPPAPTPTVQRRMRSGELTSAQRIPPSEAAPEEIVTKEPITKFSIFGETDMLGRKGGFATDLRAEAQTALEDPDKFKKMAIGFGSVAIGAPIISLALGAIGVGTSAGALGTTKAAQTVLQYKTTAAGVVGQTGGIASNPLTNTLGKKILIGAGISLGVAGLADDIVGTYPFATFELAEATDKIGIAIFQASKAGDTELVLELEQFQREMLDFNAWEKVIAKIPYANVQQAALINIKAAKVSLAAQVKLAKDTLENPESSFLEQGRTSRREQVEQEQFLRNDFEERRKAMIEFEREAKRAARDEDAAFWRREKELSFEREREELEFQAEFWLKYRQLVAKINDESRPSKLNFGLL